MTAQSSETIVYKKKVYAMASEPLRPYLDKLKNGPYLRGLRSDCWRGYFGRWEVANDMLFLTELELYSWDHHGDGMKLLFPDEDRVFANWYSGVVRLPHGELLDYVHGGYASTFEFDFFLTFKDGKLVQERWVKNKQPEKTHIEKWLEENTPDDPIKAQEWLDKLMAMKSKIEKSSSSKKGGTEGQ